MKTKHLSLPMLALLMLLSACSPFTIAGAFGEQPTPLVEAIPANGYQATDEAPGEVEVGAGSTEEGSQVEGKLISIEHVGVQVGEGSPIPVEIIASGTWPDLCAQIAEVQSKMHVFSIDITLLASTVEACPPDQLGLPFRFAFPLNIVELPEGTYTVTVNGVSNTFDLPPSR